MVILLANMNCQLFEPDIAKEYYDKYLGCLKLVPQTSKSEVLEKWSSSLETRPTSS